MQDKVFVTQDKVVDLEEKNRELTDQSRVTVLQEELIAVKLREAELSGSMKDLVQKLNSLEDSWQVWTWSRLNTSVNRQQFKFDTHCRRQPIGVLYQTVCTCTIIDRHTLAWNNQETVLLTAVDH